VKTIPGILRLQVTEVKLLFASSKGAGTSGAYSIRQIGNSGNLLSQRITDVMVLFSIIVRTHLRQHRLPLLEIHCCWITILPMQKLVSLNTYN
jgi:hypothetical protein